MPEPVLATLAARSGAKVLTSDLYAERHQIAATYGLKHPIDASREDVIAVTRAQSEGRGADVAFEAVGIEATVRAAVGAVRKGGTVTLIGNLARDVSLPLQSVVTRQVRLQGSCASSGEYPECLELIASGKVDIVTISKRLGHKDPSITLRSMRT